MKRIGGGTYGEVFSDSGLALKEINCHGEISQDFVREISALNSLKNHPHIIKVVKVNHQKIWMEKMDSDLLHFIRVNGKLNQPDCLIISRQLVSGLYTIHHSKIIHRDIGPKNILINHSTKLAKICDFGLSRYITSKDPDTHSSEICTKYYRSPELLTGYGRYGYNADIWSLGIVCLEMLTHGPEFHIKIISDDIIKVYSKWRESWQPEELDFYEWAASGFENEIKRLFAKFGIYHSDYVRQMLILDPEERPQIGMFVNSPREIEMSDVSKTDFMTRQPDITHSDRRKLFMWIMEVVTQLEFCVDSMFLAFELVDRCCLVKKMESVKYRLFGAASLILAAKVHESASIYNTTKLARLTEYGKSELAAAEMFLFRTLSFNAFIPTIFSNCLISGQIEIDSHVVYQICRHLMNPETYNCNMDFSEFESQDFQENESDGELKSLVEKIKLNLQGFQ